MEKDKISIIVPFHNVKPYLEDCLNSIKNQTYTNFEVIMLDDASNDGSELIAENFAKNDNRFLYNKLQKQKSIAAIRNIGLQKATGKYLCWIDSDDFAAKDYLKVLHTNMISGDYQMSICAYKKSKNRKSHLDSFSAKQKNMIYDADEVQRLCLSSNKIGGFLTIKMFDTKLAQKIKFYEKLKACEDLVFVIQYLDLCKKVCLTKKKLYLYYVRKGSLCHSYKLDKMLNFVKAMNLLVDYAKQNNCNYYEHAVCWRAMMTCMPIFLSFKYMRKKSAKRIKILFGYYFKLAKNTIKQHKKHKKFSFYVKFVIWIMCIYYGRYIKISNKLLKNTKI